MTNAHRITLPTHTGELVRLLCDDEPPPGCTRCYRTISGKLRLDVTQPRHFARWVDRVVGALDDTKACETLLRRREAVLDAMEVRG